MYLTSSSSWVYTFFPHKFSTIAYRFVFFMRFLLGMWTYLKNLLLVRLLFIYNGAFWSCCKSSFCFSSSELEIEIESICLVGLAALLGFLKLYLSLVSLHSTFVISLWIIFAISPQNFLLHSFWRQKNDRNLFVENKNEEAYVCLTVTHGSCQDLWNAKYNLLACYTEEMGLLFHSWCDNLVLLVLKSQKKFNQVFLNSIQVDFFSCIERMLSIYEAIDVPGDKTTSGNLPKGIFSSNFSIQLLLCITSEIFFTNHEAW